MKQKTIKKGIGFGGKTLRDMLEEKERLFKESGHYYGLKELPLMEKDPLRLERFSSRLMAAALAGRETSRQISASPYIREVAELACAYYTADGDCLLQSTGIIIHVPCMGEVIEWMIKENYEEEVGINEGDQFTSNDNRIAGLHPIDIYDLTPVFYEGELLCWAGTVIMEIDLGALAPGIGVGNATERFVDGIRFSAEKTAVNDRFVPGYERKFRWNTRMPDTVLIDRRGALAANIKMREEAKKIIEEFGADYFKQAIRELVELERRAQLERVKRRTVPGRLHTPVCVVSDMTKQNVPPQHAVHRLTLVPFDFHIKPDGKYFLDFDGAGAWGWHPNNCSPSAMLGGACLTLSQTIAYTGMLNQGAFFCLEMNLPYDTFMNPSSPYVSRAWPFQFAIAGGAAWIGMQSRAFFSRGFVEEVMAASVGGCTGFELSGRSQFDIEPYTMASMEAGGTHGSGAFAIRDGYTGFAMWLPTTDAGSAEVWELVWPLSWLGRNLLPDACGWGKYRSGYGVHASFLVYKTELLTIEVSSASRVGYMYFNSGMFGGYPAQGAFWRLVTSANTAELIEARKPLAHGGDPPGRSSLEENVKGEHTLATEEPQWFKPIFKAGDWLQSFCASWAGGFGDPIKRSTTLVKDDLDNGLLTIETCRRIYCVEARYDEKAEEWIIDEEKTGKLREKRRKERLSKGIASKQWWQERRQALIEGNIPQRLKQMYNESLEKGQRWPGEFRAFWDLPSDFEFK